MSSSFVDLHCHSTASDGTLSPTEVVELARRSNLSALALTDHDTVAGVPEAAAAAKTLAIDFLAGIEISCEFPHPGTLHLLGYGVDPESPTLKNLTTTLLAGRDNRNPRMVAKLNELGMRITMEEVEAEAGGAVIGRPHMAAVLLRKGYVKSTKEAFDLYLGTTGKAYVDKERLTPGQAISLVRQSGGLPVLAHPFQLRTTNDAQLERVVKDLVDLGLAGIEVFHSDHDDAWVDKTQSLAKRYGLLQTGGSDFHGANKKHIPLGNAHGHQVPRAMFDALVAALSKSRV
jgi:predicted metal-dependent phosphoesterase TrpH